MIASPTPAKDEAPAPAEALETPHSQAPTPAISEKKAREIAAAASNGELSEADYEEEGGGWRWSFDVKEDGKIHEIGVDATTGKIVEDKYETPEEEAHEED
jgi:uncharacterized membrane protein YkoI